MCSLRHRRRHACCLTAIEMLAMTIGFSMTEWFGKPHADGHDGISGCFPG
jgi:hypothetical protein